MDSVCNEVDRLKENYGTGASTKIVLENDTDYDLKFVDSKCYYGRWQNKPPSVVRP